MLSAGYPAHGWPFLRDVEGSQLVLASEYLSSNSRCLVVEIERNRRRRRTATVYRYSGEDQVRQVVCWNVG